jgi:hypothetical protein
MACVRTRMLSSFTNVFPETMSSSHTITAELAPMPRDLGGPLALSCNGLTVKSTWLSHGNVSFVRWYVSNFCDRNLEKVVTCAYRWLSERYQPGDYIYLFGRQHLFIRKDSHRHFFIRLFSRSIPSEGTRRNDPPGFYIIAWFRKVY